MKRILQVFTITAIFLSSTACKKETYSGKVVIYVPHGPQDIGIFDPGVYDAPLTFHRRNAIYYFNDATVMVEVELNPGTYICSTLHTSVNSSRKYFQVIRNETTYIMMTPTP
jgi:hypothetical protein